MTWAKERTGIAQVGNRSNGRSMGGGLMGVK